MNWRLRWRSRRVREQDIDDELRFHVEAHVEDLIDAGAAPRDARRQALAALGGTQPIKERVREVHACSLARDVSRDLLGALRLLRRHPGFAAGTIGLVALGIGVNTAMFTVLDAVILRPLPYPDPQQLVVLSVTPRDLGSGFFGMPSEVFQDARDADRLFDGIAAFTTAQSALQVAGADPVQVSVRSVTGRYFSVLRATPAQGRTLTTDDEQPGREAVVVVSDSLWRSALTSRPDAIGLHLTIDGVLREVVGIMPPHGGALLQSDAWVPIVTHTAIGNEAWPAVIGRLRARASRTQVAAELEALQARHLQARGDDPAQWQASVLPLKDYVVGDVRGSLIALAAAVAFVLLIVCSNVANLFLARTEQRAREFALRASLGASRGRLVRQLLTESLVVSVLGGLIGVLLTMAGTRSLAVLAASASLPFMRDIAVDGQVLLFATSLCALSATVFGLAPAWRSRHVVASSMALGRTATLGESRVHGVLLVGQVALSLVLLVGAGLLIRSIRAADTGFPTNGLGTMTVDVPPSTYATTTALASFHETVLDSLATFPGVHRAAAVNFVPFGSAMLASQFTLDTGRTWPEGEMAYNLRVSEGYFATMGVRLASGRVFSSADRADSSKVAIVSASFAREFWPDGPAVGRRLSETDHPGQADWSTVVGVVDDAKQSSFEQDIPLTVYQPLAQAPQRPSLAHMTYVFRTNDDPHGIGLPLRAVLHRLAPGLPTPAVRSMEELIGERLSAARFQARLLGTFAITALGLTLVGIFAVLGYAVSRRTREFGVRIALGASRTGIVTGVLRRSLTCAAAGVLIGTTAAWGLTRLLQDVLFGIGSADPGMFLAVAGLLFLGAAGAAVIPARRASQVDPVIALRSD